MDVRSARILTSACVVFAGAVLGGAYLMRLYQVDANGISLFVRKPPTLDFTNLWFGGRLALEGRTAAFFDVEQYRHGLRALFAPYILDSEWSYPPSLLLIAAPLAVLPLWAAYALWTVGTLAALSSVLRKAGLPLMAALLVWISPAGLNNVFFGHNGAATAALLIGGLITAERRPWLSGLCFALLTMKPHLGILVPVCLVAGRRWSAIGWSLGFTALLVVLTTVMFGVSVWTGFFSVTEPMMRSLLEAPFSHDSYQSNSVTLFTTARWIGLGVPACYAVQLLGCAVAAVVAWKIWRNPRGDVLLGAGATAALTMIATPYAYSYDTVMVAAAILIVVSRAPSRSDLLLLPAWLQPGVTMTMNLHGLVLSPVAFLLGAWVCAARALKRPLPPDAESA